ncbi:hypothetical protein BH23BAC2_BH23BAC2_21900 [soil metagenome]
MVKFYSIFGCNLFFQKVKCNPKINPQVDLNKIINIFAVIEGALLSVQYDGYREHEFERIFKEWTDVEYLVDFFETHKTDLQNGYHLTKIGHISIEEAVFQTIEEAEAFEKYILKVARKGKQNDDETLNDLVFKPLHKNDTTIKHQETKAYGINTHSWLRLYAVRIDLNLYVISGGAIKLTRSMNEREHTRNELMKLKILTSYLKEIGFEDADDYGILEIK